jgi:hypothetical protein
MGPEKVFGKNLHLSVRFLCRFPIDFYERVVASMADTLERSNSPLSNRLGPQRDSRAFDAQGMGIRSCFGRDDGVTFAPTRHSEVPT